MRMSVSRLSSAVSATLPMASLRKLKASVRSGPSARHESGRTSSAGNTVRYARQPWAKSAPARARSDLRCAGVKAAEVKEDSAKDGSARDSARKDSGRLDSASGSDSGSFGSGSGSAPRSFGSVEAVVVSVASVMLASRLAMLIALAWFMSIASMSLASMSIASMSPMSLASMSPMSPMSPMPGPLRCPGSSMSLSFGNPHLCHSMSGPSAGTGRTHADRRRNHFMPMTSATSRIINRSHNKSHCGTRHRRIFSNSIL